MVWFIIYIFFFPWREGHLDVLFDFRIESIYIYHCMLTFKNHGFQSKNNTNIT